MKLPTATFPANLQEMRRQSVKPLKRLPGRVLNNIQRSVGTKLDGKNPFKAVPSATDVKDSKGSKVLLNLLLVRPWVLVLGLWLLSMATGTLALNGMLSPRKLTMALPEPALDSDASTQSNALLKASPDQDAAAAVDETTEPVGEIAVIEVGSAVVDTAEGGSRFPVLPLLALVGSCAAGSLVISRRRAMVRMAAARAQGRKRRSRPSMTASSSARAARKGSAPAQTATATSRGLRPKKRRQRVRQSSPVVARSGGTGSRVLASRAIAQQQTAPSKRTQKIRPKAVQKVTRSMRSPARPATRVSRTQARRTTMRAASRRQPMVSVVPANESHSLDWTRGSLAHQLDVRPHRSAM